MVFVLLKKSDGYLYLDMFGSQRQAEEYIKERTDSWYPADSFVIVKQV